MPFDNLDNVTEPPWSDAVGYIRTLDIVHGWAKAYREGPREARFPSDPDAEFFPRDMDAIAVKIESDAKVIAGWQDTALAIRDAAIALEATGNKIHYEAIERMYFDAAMLGRFAGTYHADEQNVEK